MARLLSVNVGLPHDVAWNGKTVRTAVWKFPVNERRMVRKLNIDGDGQGDLAGHGGEHRAVFVYQMDSYHYWERFLSRNDFSFGQFGENFTVDGLLDEEVCIGDRFRMGSALFEVTQPRVTCYRVGIRMNEPRMPALLVAHHRPGFYFRVLQEGEVGADDEIVKVADGPERITVAETDALLYLPGHSREQLERALRIPALSKGWQTSFQEMLQHDSNGNMQGNPGLANEEPAPAWPGFKPMRVAQIRKESADVTSFVSCADRRTIPSSGPAGSIHRAAPACGSGEASRSSQLFIVRSARSRSLPHQREERSQWDWKLVSLQSRAGRRCAGYQRAAGDIHFAARRGTCGSAQRRRRGHASLVDVACALGRAIAAAGVVDLRSAQRCRTSLCAGIPLCSKAVDRGKKLHPV